ncbi:MAG: TSUP family transporter [Cloacibacterium sp.]|nr:TSUP family transporter [Cloacibacterium sp.]
MLSENFTHYLLNQHLPIFLKMEEKKILIVGGGDLAFELVLNILENVPDAFVKVVCEDLDARIDELQQVYTHLSVSQKLFHKSDLDTIDMVFIASENEELIHEISGEAKSKGILVNAPCQATINDFYLKINKNKGSIETQKNSEIKWKRIAGLSLGAFFFMILGYIVFSLVPMGEISVEIVRLYTSIDETFYWMILVGFIAQLIDGLLGMGYGVTSTAALLSIGVPLPAISGSIHTAEMFSSGASGFSHYKFGNINKKLLRFLIVPGVIGSVVGAIMLSKFSLEYSGVIKPFLAGYTFLLGVRILYQAFKKKQKTKKVKNVGWLAFFGGFLDSFGGGGWGPLVTSTLISKGKTPRFVIGTVSLSEFFVTLASALTFFAFLGLSHWQVILGLIVGGVVAAPIAAKLSGKLPVKAMFIGVGILVIIWSLNILVKVLFKIF